MTPPELSIWRYRALELLVLASLLTALNITFFPHAFDPVPADHYGWVNFHFMSILQNTNIKNYFVGYSYLEQTGDSPFPEPRYFNRYSPVTMVMLQMVVGHLGLMEKIFAIKAFFRAVFVANTICIYIICRSVSLGPLVATSVTLLIGAQYYFLYPSDMAHFDQLALLGLFIQLILLLNKRFFWFFIFTIFALHLGRNFMLILTSVFFYTCMMFRHRDAKYALFLLIHIASFVSSFAYSVAIEMHVTGKPALETGILQTFQQRTGFMEYSRYNRAHWLPYLELILERLGQGILLNNAAPATAVTVGAAVAMGLLAASSTVYRRARNKMQGCILVTAVAPALVFLVAGRKLIFFHDYTLMWLIPMFAYCIASVIAFGGSHLRSNIYWVKASILLVAVIYFTAALHLDKTWKERTHANGIIEKIQSKAALVKPGDVVCLEDVEVFQLHALLPGAIYAEKGCQFLVNRNGIMRL